MKILLIKPKWFIKNGVYRFLNNIKFSPLHLGIIAALSEGHDIKIVDADWEEIPFSAKFDLVGITVTTFTSQQAYKIADKFKETAGTKIIMGGVHPSLLPEECLQHCDSVVIGEAEYLWKQVLIDTEANKLQKIYRSDKLIVMDDIPFPRRDLLNELPWFSCIQVTRGCPNKCLYCYLPNVPWKNFRKRSPEIVYRELSGIKQKIVFIVDDNIFGDMDYAVDLFKKITPLKKIWSIQAPTTISKNETLLETMAESGCFNVQMGFQTINSESLKWAAIDHNTVDNYKEIIKKLHKYNILVTGFFIFGFDTDDKGIFDRTVEMIKEMDIDDVNLYILTPYPGTQLYEKFKSENRLFENKNRSHYGWENAVFQPKQMSPEELENGVSESYEKLFPYFKKRLPYKLIERAGLLFTNPKLLYTLLSGSLGKKNIYNKLLD